VRWPGHPALLARFGLLALRSCTSLAGNFEGAPARALFAGNAAHSFLPLDAPASAAIGLVLSIAGHAFDWPFPRGGSQRIIESLAAIATSAGAVIQVDAPVRTLKDVPVSRAVLLDVTPRQLGAVAGAALSPPYRRQLARYRYGPAAFKVDYALSSPIPWRAPACARAATVHVGGTLEEIARAEAACNDGRVPDAPFVLVAQQSLMDDTRAPRGAHTAWAYCHVPHGATADMTAAIERQIERFAPGFRDVILARHAMPPQALEAYNPNLVGGDIGGGSNAIGQFLFRPFPRWNPYTTSNPAIFLCSASTPPGAGVHGMCGYWAARTALDRVFNRRPPPALTW
jgi:phytoene dehydrogenase-like protein